MQSFRYYIWHNKPPNQTGFTKLGILLAIILVSGLFIRSMAGHALSTAVEIKSGVSGYCLDVKHDNKAAGAAVDNWKCNDSAAQQWSTTGSSIIHEDACLSVAQNGVAAGSQIVTDPCTDSPGQVWLRDKTGYLNPNSGLCLASADATKSQPLVLADCSNLNMGLETWTAVPSGVKSSQSNSCDNDNEGQAIACYAEQDWAAWQSGTPSHEALLTQYTDGAPYEAWCADFVSYVYKQAGYPFKGGETDGWDENIAGNIQYQGFIKHAASNYMPQPGDIAFFDYPGGHVEIVISGGKTPTFVYGNSARIDPTTGNGEMEANTVTNDGWLGQVIYYLSPQK
jgi:hypothetical protein